MHSESSHTFLEGEVLFRIIAMFARCLIRKATRKTIQCNVPSHPLLRHSRRWATLTDILQRVQDGKLSAADATKMIAGAAHHTTNDQLLESFANLDHGRSMRAGFPEAVFAEGKTVPQVASILDSMARNVNELISQGSLDASAHGNAILATR